MNPGEHEISSYLKEESFTGDKPIIAVSACVLGRIVRYNKGHTHDKWLTQTLGKFVEFTHICPEVEMGLGVPREEIGLCYCDDESLRLRQKKSGNDVTDLAYKTYETINARLKSRKINGCVLMKKSPSCGLKRVKAVSCDGTGPVKHLGGLFGENIMTHFPLVPAIDSGRFQNIILKEHFIKNIFAHFRLSKIERSTRAVQDYHKKYKYILMEHNQASLKKLGAIAANHDNLSGEEVWENYRTLFINTICKPPTMGKRYNTMLHIMGYFKDKLEREDKAHLLRVLNDFKDGILEYNVPMNLFSFFVNKYDISYLKDQYYFNPYPKELRLQKEL